MPLSVHNLVSRLSLRQLQVFQAVYQQRGYGKAADLLGLTQPAVSSQIKHLEDALGQKLFEFIGRKLYSTAAGETVARSVDEVFNQLREMQNSLHAMEGQVAGDLRIAVVSTAQYIVPYLLKPFRDQHPAVNITVHVGNRARVVEQLFENRNDLVIMGIVPDDRPLSSLPFLDSETIPVVRPDHPLAQRESVALDELMAQPLLVRERGSGSRRALELHCQQYRQKLEPAMQMGSNEALKHAVLAGLGVAVLSRFSVQSELQLGLLVSPVVEGFPLRRSMCLVYPSNKNLSLTASRFVEYVKQNLGDINREFAGIFAAERGGAECVPIERMK